MDAVAYTGLHLLLAFLAGLLLAGVWGLGRIRALERENARLAAKLAAEREKSEWLVGSKDELAQVFTALTSRSLQESSRTLVERTQELLSGLDRQLDGRLGAHKAELAGLVGPLRENLEKLERQVGELESKRQGAYGSLEEQLRALAEQQRALQQATTTLGQALKSSSARGQWGELQLKRVVELAGMTAHVDYAEQVSTAQGRPDLVVYLPGGGVLPVDAKASLAAYLEALEAEDEASRKVKLKEHARQLRARVRELASKAYWQAFETAPDFVVLFVPSEAALAAAFEADASLLDDALAQKVLPASPVTLLALLKSVAYGWQQRELSDNARQIARWGQLLIQRMDTLLNALNDVGKGLEKSTAAYNRAVGSYQKRLAPLLRRLRDDLGEAEGVEPEPLDLSLRTASNEMKPED